MILEERAEEVFSFMQLSWTFEIVEMGLEGIVAPSNFCRVTILERYILLSEQIKPQVQTPFDMGFSRNSKF